MIRPPPPRSPHTLSVEQAALLCCMRSWTLGRPGQARIETLMHRLGAEEATTYLDTFMTRLGLAATRPFRLARTEQSRVGTDERLLLGILTFAQESRTAEALLLLRGLVSPPAARPVLRSAEALGTELALAGRFLCPADIAMPPIHPAPAWLH